MGFTEVMSVAGRRAGQILLAGLGFCFAALVLAFLYRLSLLISIFLYWRDAIPMMIMPLIQILGGALVGGWASTSLSILGQGGRPSLGMMVMGLVAGGALVWFYPVAGEYLFALGAALFSPLGDLAGI